LGLAFFGLRPENKIYIFSEIHELVFHGGGGFTYDIVYNMPIWLRKYHIRRIKDWFDKQNSLNKNLKSPPSDQPLGPGVKSMKNYTGKTKLYYESAYKIGASFFSILNIY
jgi:hypothetical protein